MADISQSNNDLINLIINMEHSNNRVMQIIGNINKEIRTLDNTKWFAREKEIVDKDLNSFMADLDNNYGNYLKECTQMLRKSAAKYQSVDNALKDDANSQQNVVI